MSALRRLLSGATTHNNTEATAPAPSPIARLSTSMSFNDMSMGTAMDAAELDTIPSPAACLGRDGRRSLDSCLSSGRSSMEAVSMTMTAPVTAFHVGSLPTTSGDVRAMLWRSSTGSFPPTYGPTRTPAINIPPSSPGATKAALAAAALATGTPARGGASVGVSPPGPTTPLAAGPAGAAGEASHAARRAARPARAGPRPGAAGKIDGLDYYEYVELIRASSL